MVDRRQDMINARHAQLCQRPDLAPHELGCEEPECVAACEAGFCQCAGCEAHMEGWIAIITLDDDHADDDE